MARALIILHRTLEEKDKLIAEQQQVLTAQAPKVKYFEEYIDTSQQLILEIWEKAWLWISTMFQ